jgi:hypothetical protein
MPEEEEIAQEPIIIDGKRYKYAESSDGLCQECAGYDDFGLCERLPSCVDGGYFVEAKEEKP